MLIKFLIFFEVRFYDNLKLISLPTAFVKCWSIPKLNFAFKLTSNVHRHWPVRIALLKNLGAQKLFLKVDSNQRALEFEGSGPGTMIVVYQDQSVWKTYLIFSKVKNNQTSLVPASRELWYILINNQIHMYYITYVHIQGQEFS